MAESFADQYAKRSGVFAPAAPADPKAAAAPAKKSVVDTVLEKIGMGKQPVPTPAPTKQYAPSLYDQVPKPAAPPPSFVDMFNSRTGIFAGAPDDQGVAGTHEEAKTAGMASFLDTTPDPIRAAGEKAAAVEKRTVPSPFKLTAPEPSMGFDWTRPKAVTPPPKPEITMPTQEQLDNPKIAKAYQEAAVAFNQPKSLVEHLADAYDSYNRGLARVSEGVAIGEVTTVQSLLDFLGVYAPKIKIGDFGKNVGRGSTDVADRLQSWLDRVTAPETIATDLSQAEAKRRIDAMAKQGQKAIMIPTDETPEYAPSLYDQKPTTFSLAVPKYNEFTDQLAQGIGSSAVFFLPGLGIARGAQMLGTVSPRLAMLFGNSASAALEAMSESGNIYRAQIAAGEGREKAEADATKSFWANAILVGLTNRFGAFNPETSGFIRRMVMSSPIEGVQEVAQQMIGNNLQHRDLMEGTGNSFLIGSIVGGLMGGGVETLAGESGGQDILKQPLQEGAQPIFPEGPTPAPAAAGEAPEGPKTPVPEESPAAPEATAAEPEKQEEAAPKTDWEEMPAGSTVTPVVPSPEAQAFLEENEGGDQSAFSFLEHGDNPWNTGANADLLAGKRIELGSDLKVFHGSTAGVSKVISEKGLRANANNPLHLALQEHYGRSYAHARETEEGPGVLTEITLKKGAKIYEPSENELNQLSGSFRFRDVVRELKKKGYDALLFNDMGLPGGYDEIIVFNKSILQVEKSSPVPVNRKPAVDPQKEIGDVAEGQPAPEEEKAAEEQKPEEKETPEKKRSDGALAFNIKNLHDGVLDNERGEAEVDKIVKRSEMAKQLAEGLGVPVRTGHFSHALGIFKPWAHVVRLKSKLGDIRIPVLVHESAHFIDYTLFGTPEKGKGKSEKNWRTTEFVSDKIPRAELDPLLQEYGGTPNSKKREAFAEFVRFWVTEPAKAQARAPKFLEIWEKEIMPAYPEVRDILLTTRADWQRWQKMPAAAKVVAQISFGEPKKTIAEYKQAIVETWHDSLARWTDDLYPIRRFTTLARSRGVKLELENDPYILARLSRGWVGKAGVFLEKGTFDTRFWKEVNGKAEPLFTGKGFTEIISPAVMNNSVEDLSVYLVSRRAKQLNARGVHSGIEEKTAIDAFDEVSKQHPEFAKIAAELDKYQDALLTYIYHSGLLTEKTYFKLKEMNRDYVPFFRVMDEAQKKGLSGRTMVDLSSPLKRIKGSDRDIINPLESIVKNTYALVNAAERNRVGIAMTNLAKKHPELAQLFEDVPVEQTKVASVKINDLIDQVATKNLLSIDFEGGENPELAKKQLGDLGEEVVNIFRPSMIHDENILTVMVDGKSKSFYVDPEIYKALHGSELEDVGLIWKLLSYPSRWLRAGATLTPEFIVRNPARDLMSAFVYSNYGFIPPIDVPRGLFGLYTKDNAYWLWRMGGGEQAMLTSIDRTTLQKTYEDLAAEHNIKSLKGVMHLAGKYKNPLEILRLGSEFTEKMTRLAEAKKAIDRGANPLEAAYSSREVTLDFAKMGSKARTLNMIIAFFNANIQGTVRMVNAFKDKPYRTTAKTLMGITLPSILLALWNRQEPDWSEIPQWQKDLFWMIKIGDTWYRFPKPFELGVLFGSVPERVMESILDKDPNVWPELRKAALDGMTPGFLPTFMQPIIENITNYSFFLGRAIVPDSAEELPAFAQYNSYTSETAKTIGKWVGYSPAKIDNLLRGYFAGLGAYATQAADKIIRGIKGIEAPPAPAPTIADMPLIKAFVVREPIGSSSESVNRFYNAAEKARAARNYFNQLQEKGDTAAADQWLADHSAEIALAPFYDRTRKTISTMRAVQQMVRESKITPEEKRRKMDDIDRLVTNIAHMAINVNVQNADAVYKVIENQAP